VTSVPVGDILELGPQKWRALRRGELTLFIYHAPRHKENHPFDVDLTFVPGWLNEEDYESEHRTMNIFVTGEVPRFDDWRELAGFEAESRDGIVVQGEQITSDLRGPEIELWSHGPGGIHTHAKEGWNTRLIFGEREGDGYDFPFSLEAFYPTQRARKAHLDLWMKEMFGQDV